MGVWSGPRTGSSDVLFSILDMSTGIVLWFKGEGLS